MATFLISLFDKVVDDDSSGYSLCADASEIGVPPGRTPPSSILIEGADGSTDRFDLCGRVYDKERDQFQYWSYWNSDPGTAVNLQIFND